MDWFGEVDCLDGVAGADVSSGAADFDGVAPKSKLGKEKSAAMQPATPSKQSDVEFQKKSHVVKRNLSANLTTI